MIGPAPAQKSVPEQIGGRVQFGDKGIRIPGAIVSAHRTAPSGIAVTRYIDIPAPVHSDAVDEIIPRIGRAQGFTSNKITGHIQFIGYSLEVEVEIP